MRWSGKILINLALLLLLGGCAANWPAPGAGNTPSSQTGQEIAGLAKGLVGAPYRFGGDTPQGFDCSGLVEYVHERVGLDVPRQVDAQYAQSARVPVRSLAPGDLVFFRIAGSRISHVGIYVGRGRFVHAPSSGGEVEFSRLRNAYWWNRFAGAGRLFGGQP